MNWRIFLFDNLHVRLVDVAPMPESFSERNKVIFASIVANCWKDKEYRDRFIAAPNDVCLSEGIIIPEGMKFIVRENTPQSTYAVLPSQDAEVAIEQFAEVLKAVLPLQEGHSFTLVQNTDKINYLIIPPPPAELNIELADDAELELAVGGNVTEVHMNTFAVANAAVAANAAAATEVAAVTLGVTAALAVCVLILYPFNVPEFIKNSQVKTLELE